MSYDGWTLWYEAKSRTLESNYRTVLSGKFKAKREDPKITLETVLNRRVKVKEMWDGVEIVVQNELIRYDKKFTMRCENEKLTLCEGGANGNSP